MRIFAGVNIMRITVIRNFGFQKRNNQKFLITCSMRHCISSYVRNTRTTTATEARTLSVARGGVEFCGLVNWLYELFKRHGWMKLQTERTPMTTYRSSFTRTDFGTCVLWEPPCLVGGGGAGWLCRLVGWGWCPNDSNNIVNEDKFWQDDTRATCTQWTWRKLICEKESKFRDKNSQISQQA